MKRSRFRIWAIGLLIFMIISNVPPIKTLFSSFIDENHYRYSNADGSFTSWDIPFKRRLYNLNLVVPNNFKEAHSNTKDTLVYRLFCKNPLSFWRWWEYFYDKRYKLPYKSWKEIRKRRGYDLKYSNNWQDF